jgi:TonB family protein
MKTFVEAGTYGYQELRQVYQRYMTYSLSLAVSIIVTGMIGYHMLQSPPTIVRNGNGRDSIKIVWRMWQPPLDPVHRGGIVVPDLSRFEKGILVPVPEFMLDSSKEFASQEQMAKEADQHFLDGEKEGDGWGTVVPPEPFYPSPDTFIAFEIEPKVVMNPKPVYPELLVRTGIEGEIFLKVLIAADGKVKNSIVLQSSNDLFIPSAEEAVKKWVFTPALMNGRPVPIWVAIPFRFRLATK